MATNAERGDRDFYETVPVFAGFPAIMDPAQYAPLPDDWLIGDHRRRRFDAGDRGRPLQGREHGRRGDHRRADQCAAGRPFPFVFGGDGASLAVSSRDEAAARAALAATAAWSRDELDLALRAALVPVAAVRAQGLDVERRAVRAVAPTSPTRCSPAAGSRGRTGR